MDWISVEEAKGRPGLRMVLIRGGWGAWSECAKNVLHVKKLVYAPVPQVTFEENAEIVAWTGVRNQPQAVFDGERVRTGWLDILTLAERLAPEPALLPGDAARRALVVGLSNELLGEGGLGWCKRLQVVRPDPAGPAARILREDYGLRDEGVRASAERRIAEIVAMLGQRLREQADAGSGYFVGEELSAIDVYWATMSNMLRPLPADLCPMSDRSRAMFSDSGPLVEAALDPRLIEHRDRIYQAWLQLPVDFG